MATYQELYNALNAVENDGLKAQVSSSVIIAAEAKITDVAATAGELSWAYDTLLNPKPDGKRALLAVMAANKGIAIASMQGATDAAVQSQVDDIIDGLVAAHGA